MHDRSASSCLPSRWGIPRQPSTAGRPLQSVLLALRGLGVWQGFPAPAVPAKSPQVTAPYTHKGALHFRDRSGLQGLWLGTHMASEFSPGQSRAHPGLVPDTVTGPHFRPFLLWTSLRDAVGHQSQPLNLESWGKKEEPHQLPLISTPNTSTPWMQASPQHLPRAAHF